MLCTKLKKKWYRNPFKNSSQINTKLGSILHPTWLHFGRFLEVKMEPNSLQDVFKMQSFFHSFLASFFIDFYPNLAPTWSQLGPNLASKSTPKFIQDPSWSDKVKKIQPKWGPNSSLSTNMSPKTPKVAPGRPHVPHFHWFLIDFWWIFDTIFIDFFSFFIYFWSHVNWCFHVFGSDSGAQRASFLVP